MWQILFCALSRSLPRALNWLSCQIGFYCVFNCSSGSILLFHDQINAYKVLTVGQDTRPCGSGAPDDMGGVDPR